jgi:hypothetical protein
MIYVRNEEAIYTRWLNENENGFVANLYGETAMTHTSRCSHLFPPEPSREHTWNAKVCSRDLATVEEFAGVLGYPIVRCQTCLRESSGEAT